MQNQPRPDRDPLADATNIVPLGIHHGNGGKLMFDTADDAMLEDVRTLAAAFESEYPSGDIAPPGFAEHVLSLARQRDAMSHVLSAMMVQMQERKDGPAEVVGLETLLASTFDRFPHFVDFHDIASGSGDMALDTAHEDHALFSELSFNLATGAGS